MRYTLFGRSGLRISELALGAPTFGEDWGWGANREESKKMFDALTNTGSNFIGTAHVCVHERLKRDADYYASYRPVPESQVPRKVTMKARYRVLLSAIFIAVALLSACEREAAIESITGTATSIDGVTIKYEVAGQGEPALVFVHCWSCNRRFWDDQVAYFAPRYRVVRLDLAGHGGSGRGRGDYTIETFGADVAAVIEQLALKRVILIGHSMGGPVAVEVEKRLGDRVIGVVGVDTFYTGFKAPEGKEAVAALKPLEDNFPEATDKFLRTMFPPGTNPALVERIIGTMRAADKEVALSALKNAFAWQAHQSETSLRRLGSKLRNINADPKSENKPLHENVMLIAGAGHFVAQEKPTEFNHVLEGIVRDLIHAKAQSATDNCGTRLLCLLIAHNAARRSILRNDHLTSIFWRS